MLFETKATIGIHACAIFNDVTPTSLTIFGTAQMLEARRINYYEGFDPLDLHKQAKSILQTQMYIIYHIGLTRYMMQHAVGANFVKKFYFEVTPQCFVPSTDEINKYIANPKFMWRFSAWNYNAMIPLFDPKSRSKKFDHGFKTYDEDQSPIMSYVESRNHRMKNNLKLNLKKLDIVKYEQYNFEKYDTIQKYFDFKLNKYEQSEIYYSDDFFLHCMDGNTTYDEYAHIIITSDCRRYPSDLLLEQIQIKNDNLMNPGRSKLFKKVNKRVSNSNDVQSALKYMSSKFKKQSSL